MATAYTPGLKVTQSATITKTRRLPLKGEVVVEKGDLVTPDSVVARTDLPGIMQTVRVAEILGVDVSEVGDRLKIAVGDKVEKGTVIAETKSFFGLMKSECKSPIAGTIELISDVSGHVGIRQPPTPVEVNAYVQGKVIEIIPQEGVVIETHGALVQGIFGVGGEQQGELVVIANGPDDLIDSDRIENSHAGKILVTGASITGAALKKAAGIGINGIVVGTITDSDLVEYLGYDIGVAITGHECIPTTLVITEGFGSMSMAKRTFDLLNSLNGRLASINGATQIRAGVIRPEIIVPSDDPSSDESMRDRGILDIGTRIRMIREPYFGTLGKVAALPPQPTEIESGATVRVLEAQLDDGSRVAVPRANVEIIQG